MKSSSFHILRVGLAITFLWIGVLIFQDLEGWGTYLQPWAAELLPIPIQTVMIGTAIFNITVGIFLLIDYFTWVAAFLAAFHLALVLTVSGIDAITVRDIGLLAAALALAVSAWPENFRFLKKRSD